MHEKQQQYSNKQAGCSAECYCSSPAAAAAAAVLHINTQQAKAATWYDERFVIL
jgi:hypothetical protein